MQQAITLTVMGDHQKTDVECNIIHGLDIAVLNKHFLTKAKPGGGFFKQK